MNDDQLNDLKQFVAATISQATANMATKDGLKNLATKVDVEAIKIDFRRLEQKVDDGFAGIADAVEDINARHDNHEGRITRLEQQAA